MTSAQELPRTPDLRESFELAGIDAWDWDIASGRLVWSEGVEEKFGIPPGTFNGRFDGFLDLLPEQERAVVEDAVDRALRGETATYEVEHRVVSRHGRVLWLECRGRVIRDASGKPVRMKGVVIDMTARKASEARVTQLRRLSAVVSAINKRILHVENERELFDSACRIAVELGLFRFAWVGLVKDERVEAVARFGYDEGYLDTIRVDLRTSHAFGPTGTAVREGRYCVVSDIASDARFAPWRDAALARGYRSCGAFPLRRMGHVVGALVVYADTPRLFDDEQIALLAGLVDDISYALDLLVREEQRDAAELAMRASEERYRTLFEQAFEGIFLVDSEHRIVDANESACRMLGYTRAELFSIRVERIIDPADITPLRFETIPKGNVLLRERRFVRKDGSFLEGEVSTKALADGRFQCVLRDVTERKTVQAQLLLADRMTSLGRLASGVAHEVNNPLAYVMLNLELVAKRLADAASVDSPDSLELMRRAVADARDGAERMRRIVRMLSTFGRGDEERVGPVDVNGVLDSAAEIAAMQLRHRARIVKQYDATLPASANDFRLAQVFVNLLVNAADALRDHDPSNEIRLRTYVRDGRDVVVEVIDNGVGMPREVQAKIFDPFFTTKPIGKGTGLGLSVCHAIVTSFGGSIGVESAPGVGTTFRVSLPIARIAQGGRAGRAGASAPQATGRVLVVDDDDKVAFAIASALDGNDVVVVSSGREAIERCRAEWFDCILCDLMMPEVTGMDVYEALRRDERGLERRVVFMTGGAVTRAARELLSRASNPVLEKPVDATALREMVAKTISRPRGRDVGA